jgi:cell division septum initiation protein DivIVA
MSDKVEFQIQPEGYSPLEVDTYVALLLDNYEELLGHYLAGQEEVDRLTAQLNEKNNVFSKEYHEEALELLNETTKVVTRSRKKARSKITAMIDQTSLHARRMEDSLQVMKDELDKMYVSVDNQF